MMAKYRTPERRSRRRAKDYALLAEVLAVLTASSLAIRLLTFRIVMKLAGWPLQHDRLSLDRQHAVCMRIRWAVIAWAKRLPWRPVCFPQGLATQWLLRRRDVPSVLCYGAKPDETGKLIAHVWVCVGETIVIGGETVQGMGVLARFPDDEQDAAWRAASRTGKPVITPAPEMVSNVDIRQHLQRF